jgi:hypothetical protein
MTGGAERSLRSASACSVASALAQRGRSAEVAYAAQRRASGPEKADSGS